MPVLFPGIGISGYRSFGSPAQFLAPLDRVNVIIGPNNAGKSTLLSLFEVHLGGIWDALAAEGRYPLASPFRRRIETEPHRQLQVTWPVDTTRINVNNTSQELNRLAAFLTNPDRSGWPTFNLGDDEFGYSVGDEYLSRVMRHLSDEDWKNLAGGLTRTSNSAPGANQELVLEHVRKTMLLPPPAQIVLIPAHREITARPIEGAQIHEWHPSGNGLVIQLDNIKNPEHDDHTSRHRRRMINARVKDILQLRDFDFVVSRPTQALSLVIDGEQRPIGALGTGYEHIFHLVAMTVVYPEAFLCVEEPEVHMHPRLQRRLAQYLNESTSNQLLISTHSATLIDALHGTTFGIAMEGNATRVSLPVARKVLDVFDDLGYRASDLLQANCIIWVEGPSDRIYINAWLQSHTTDFVEGRDYQIMFYGGGLLSHLTVSDSGDPQADRIPLHLMNQRFVVIADSDKFAHDTPLRERVFRLVEEATGNSHGFVWVTGGRTIENYIAHADVVNAIKRVHESVKSVTPVRDHWDYALSAQSETNHEFKVDKVAVAREITATVTPDLSVLDLRGKIEDVIETITKANS